MKRLLSAISLLSLTFLAQRAQAYPETVRHGYVSCGVCHVSMAGGGTLTPYGRALAAEFMATWAKEGEGQPLHGAVKNIPENLIIGGGVRSVQTYADNPKFRQGRYFFMQEDVEAGWTQGPFTVVASYGLNINSPDTSDDDTWESARHYVAVNLNDNVTIRVGKFEKAYGLNIPNHTAQIRRGLGWDEFSETYNAEINYFTDTYQLSFTGIGGRPDDKGLSSERGFSVNGYFLHLKPDIRIGGSYFAARATDDTNREIFGPSFTWGVTKRLALMGEYDWVRVAPATGELLEGYATYSKASFEIIRGLDATFTHEMKKNDREKKDLDFLGYGPGVSWMPRPHFQLTGEWQKQQTTLYDRKLVDSAWFVTQYWF